MHIIIVGLGEVGRHLLGVLEGEGHDVVAVDSSPAAVEYAESHYDVLSTVGYGASLDVLKRAGADRAGLFVAVTNNDEINLIAALQAKQLGAKRVVARTQGDNWARWTEGVRYDVLGVDVVVNPRVLAVQELARIARSHGALDVIDLAQQRVELVQIGLGEQSRLVNKAMGKLGLPRDTKLVAVVREGTLFVPGGADVLLPGDRAYLLGSPNDLLAAEDLFSAHREARRVAIVGGGVIGRGLARALVAAGVEVMLIERDRERAERLAAELHNKVTVLCGDATNKELLEEEEAGTYELFASVTADDEINLMTSLLAKGVGASRTAAVVQRADYLPIYRQLGVDIALSPRSLASDYILRFARDQNFHTVRDLEDGQAQVVEVQVRSKSRVVDVTIGALDLPRGAMVAALLRGNETRIPTNDDVISVGDTALLVVTKTARLGVERLFRN